MTRVRIPLLSAALGAIFAVASAATVNAEDEWRRLEMINSNLGAVIRSAVQGSYSPANSPDRYEAAAEIYRAGMEQTVEGELKLQYFYEGFAEHNDTIDAYADRWARQFPKSPAPYVLKAQRRVATSAGLLDGPLRGRASPALFARDLKGLAAAAHYLEQIRKQASADPYWHTLVATVAVARGEAPATVERLVADGLKLHPRNTGLAVMGTNRTLPKWGGNADALEAYAQRLTAIVEPAEGPGIYAQIYWYAFSAEYEYDLFRRSKVNWARLKPALDDLVARHPGQKNRNIAALFSCLAGDLDEAKRYILAPDFVPHMGVWVKREALVACWRWARGKVDPEGTIEH